MGIFSNSIRTMSFLRFSAGRNELRVKLQKRLWPQLKPIATIYRKWFLSRVKFIVVVGSLGKTTTTANVRYLLGLKVKDKFESNAFGAVAAKVLLTNPLSKYQVIEVGIAQEGDMEKYAQMICPDYVIITSIANDHIEHLGTLENIISEKAKVFKSKVPPKLILFNGDDENVKLMVGETAIPKKDFGINAGAYYQCQEAKMNWPEGYEITMSSDRLIRKFKVRLFGKQMVNCFIAAYSIAKELNIPNDIILKRSKAIRPVNGRMQVKRLANGSFLIRDDFKASIESINAAYAFLNGVPALRKFIVQGNISHVISPQRSVYRQVGFKAGEVADFLFSISGTALEQALSARAKDAGMDKNRVFKAKGNWNNIIKEIEVIAKKGDVILVKASRMQKIERLSLSLMGVKVTCSTKKCPLKYSYCKDCSLLTKV